MNIKEQCDIYFGIIKDTRKYANVTYELNDVLFMVTVGILCNCKNIEVVVQFSEEKIEFLKQYTTLETIPCENTVRNILEIVNPEQLQTALYNIFTNVFKLDIDTSGRQICIDGKTINSTSKMKEYEKPLHIVTALLADESISIGQKAVESKSNEIPAVRELLELIDIKGAVVTMDAMHCQKETAELIIEKGGDYVLQLKANQGNFYEDVYAMFEEKYMDIADKDCEYEKYTTIEKGHGRIEKRTCYVLKDVEYFTDYIVQWKGLKKIFAVKREIEKDGKKTREISCYLSSKNATAEQLLSYTRKHWQIESFHWLLDVHCEEDNSRVRNKNVEICLNIIRKFCISMIKKYIENHNVKRKTIIANMRKCAFNEDFLIDVLSYYFNCSNDTEEK